MRVKDKKIQKNMNKMSSHEQLLIMQTEKQLLALQNQAHSFLENLNKERKLIDKVIAEEIFTGGKSSDYWEVASFYILGEIKGKWAPLSGLSVDEGLYIAGRILRCKEPITLRSLALEVKLEVNLSTDSEIWIITRGTGTKDPNAAILRISKESDIDGTFIRFGSPIGIDNDFIFFKRQQIPEEKYDPSEECTNLYIRMKDNGDDRIDVCISVNTLQSVFFQTYCNRFIPSVIDNHVMIAGYGKKCIVKSLFIQQKERTSIGIIMEGPNPKRQLCCQII